MGNRKSKAHPRPAGTEGHDGPSKPLIQEPKSQSTDSTQDQLGKKEREIATKMRYDVERKMGIIYTRYDVSKYINDGDKYSFRVYVDNGVIIDVCGEYIDGKVNDVYVWKVSNKDSLEFFTVNDYVLHEKYSEDADSLNDPHNY